MNLLTNYFIILLLIFRANILLDKSFTAKLGDFGLAREMPKTSSTGSYIKLSNLHTPGTLGYLANEYLNTKKLSAEV